jgi:hypothetical protein
MVAVEESNKAEVTVMVFGRKESACVQSTALKNWKLGVMV